MFGLPCLLGVALNGFYWRIINILQGVIGPEPWDYVGTMITHTYPLKLISSHVRGRPCPQTALIIFCFNYQMLGPFESSEQTQPVKVKNPPSGF